MSEESARTLKQILGEAHAAEVQSDHENAIRLYKEAISTDQLSQAAYSKINDTFQQGKEI